MRHSSHNFVFYIKIKLLHVCNSSFNFTDVAGSQISRKVSKNKDRIKVNNKGNECYFTNQRALIICNRFMVLEIDDTFNQNSIDFSEYLYCDWN